MKKSKYISMLIFFGALVGLSTNSYGLVIPRRNTHPNAKKTTSKGITSNVKRKKEINSNTQKTRKVVTAQENAEGFKDRLINLIKQELANRRIQWNEDLLNGTLDEEVLINAAISNDMERIVVSSIVDNIEMQNKKERESVILDELRSEIKGKLARLNAKLPEENILQGCIEGVLVSIQQGEDRDSCVQNLIDMLIAGNDSGRLTQGNGFVSFSTEMQDIKNEPKVEITITEVNDQGKSLILSNGTKLTRKNVRGDGNCLIYSVFKSIVNSLKFRVREGSGEKLEKIKREFPELIKFIDKDDLSEGTTGITNRKFYSYNDVLKEVKRIRDSLKKEVESLLIKANKDKKPSRELSQLKSELQSGPNSYLSEGEIPLLMKILGFKGNAVVVEKDLSSRELPESGSNGYSLEEPVYVYFQGGHYQAYVHSK